MGGSYEAREVILAFGFIIKAEKNEWLKDQDTRFRSKKDTERVFQRIENIAGGSS